MKEFSLGDTLVKRTNEKCGEAKLQDRKEANSMRIPVVTLTRRQLYDEIWELSVAGTAKKYEIPYAQMMKQVKLSNIPVPPSGYWTKLSFGKPVEKAELQGNGEEQVPLYKEFSVAESKMTESCMKGIQPPTSGIPQEETLPKKTESQDNVVEAAHSCEQEAETFERCGKLYNIYDRETLYQEVWTIPVTEVAKKYHVSDVAIHKVCKSLDIPTPPAGYWAKLRAGKKTVARPPLPQTGKPAKKAGAQTIPDPLRLENAEDILAFLGAEERSIILTVASQIILPGENDRMHPAIIAYRKEIAAWKKQTKDIQEPWRLRNLPKPLFLATEVSDESVPRACRIIDAISKAIEPLGCKLTEKLTFIVNGEEVALSFSEAKDKVPHVPTKEENRKLLEYEERRKRFTYESKPQIHKYDQQYTGRLSCSVNGEKIFRDCKAYRLEDRIGDIMVEMYVAAEKARQRRLAREEAERIRQEEQRKKEELRQHYNEEVDRTIALENEADDYDMACKIRAYIAAYQAAHPHEDVSDWTAWAREKADWYDPTISCKDAFFGSRDHTKDKEQKKPKHKSYWW